MVDEQGNFVDGDFIMAICAMDMKSRGKAGGQYRCRHYYD